jgi:hypothetical protein
MRVPWGIIEQIVHPAGRRLPAEPGLFPVTEHDAKHRPWTGRPTYHPPEDRNLLQLVRNNRKNPLSVGNLLNVDYREFAGTAREDSDFAVCRGCDTTCRTKAARDMHRTTCKTTILASIRLLGKDELCAVCDKKTGVRMWGVPLCNQNCQMAWRYFIPKSFREARRLVIQMGKEGVSA